MANAPHGSPTTASRFDMRQAEETWKNFNRLAKWMMIITLIVLVFMAAFLTGSHPPRPL
ncbi:MAG TPA: aa3-type cytochrome c oxidase subunit IV [Alphaproteobacteria bacterium]